MTDLIILSIVAIVCVLVATYQARRADQLVALLLQRDAEQRQSRTELVEVFLEDQRVQEDRHAAERALWRDERGELLNTIIGMQTGTPTLIAPAWPEGPPEKLHRTEDDEIAEARARVADRIQEQLDIRLPLMPNAAGDIAA
jgi:hypothetical protein